MVVTVRALLARTIRTVLPLVAVLLLPWAAPAQMPLRTGAAAEVRDRARRAQDRFERTRLRHLPRTLGGGGGGCDEHLGRLCLRLDPGSGWWPRPEDPRILEERRELLAVLADVGGQAPDDDWIRGQRVLYLSECGDWHGALEVARGCPGGVAWCHALRGFALHGLGRYTQAERAFRRALDRMDPQTRADWMDPSGLYRGEARERLHRLREEDPSGWEAAARRTWSLSDPYLLVPGNDRWTEHLSRKVVAAARRGAANPYRLSWADDLAEAVVRYGWEVGWDVVPPRPGQLASAASATGHHHPRARAWMAPEKALTDPASTGEDVWNPAARMGERSEYAPPYAPVTLPPAGHVVRVPRGDSLTLLAVVGLPPDTTFHTRRGRSVQPDSPGLGRPPGRLPRPASSRRVAPGAPARVTRAQVGLFAERVGGSGAQEAPPATGSRPVAVSGRAAVRGGVGAVMITLPRGRWVTSAEILDLDSLRGGRIRQGVHWEGLPPDVPALSDLMMLSAGGPEPTRLEEVLPLAATGPWTAGGLVRVGWSIFGLGWRAETLRYHLTLRRAPGGAFDRALRFLRLRSPGEEVRLDWQEPGPEAPGDHLRTAVVTLPPDLDPGRYLLSLRVDLEGRVPLTALREVEVGPGPPL